MIIYFSLWAWLWIAFFPVPKTYVHPQMMKSLLFYSVGYNALPSFMLWFNMPRFGQ